MTSNPPFSDFRTRFKAIVRTKFAALFELTGLAYLWHALFARRAIRILAYHGVETPPSSPFSVYVERFEEQIAYLSRHCEVIDFDTFLKWTDGRYESGKPKVVITFDDGFKNNLVHAAPILAKYGTPATFFVIGSKLEGNDDRFMKVADAQALLQSNLFQVGSHSLNHLSMGRISEESKNDEIGKSKAILKSKLGRNISYFCYPYGTYNDFDRQSIDLLKKHGYALACTSINGVNFKTTSRFKLRRTKIEWNDDMRTFGRLVHGAMDAWIVVDYLFRFLQRPRAVSFDQKNAQDSHN